MFGSHIRRVASLALVGSAVIAASFAAPASAAPSNVTLKLPDVKVSQHNPPAPAGAGSAISFSFELSNVGGAVAQNVTLEGKCHYEYAGNRHAVNRPVQPFSQGWNLQPGQSAWINLDCGPAHNGTLFAASVRAVPLAGEIKLSNNEAVWMYP